MLTLKSENDQNRNHNNIQYIHFIHKNYDILTLETRYTCK